MEAAAKQTADASIEAARQTFEFTERQIRSEEEIGIISHRVALQRLQDAVALESRTTQTALGKEAGVFDPIEGGKELQEFTEVENKMLAEKRKTALQMEQITEQETLKFVQQWKKVEQTFNRDFTSAFNAWATKSETATQAFGHMFGQMELQLADFVAEWLLKKAELWVMDEAMQLAGITKEHIQSGASNVATVTGAALTAAAVAAAAAAAGGPPAMVAAGAAAAGTVEALGSAAEFDTGGMLPHMGMAFEQIRIGSSGYSRPAKLRTLRAWSTMAATGTPR